MCGGGGGGGGFQVTVHYTKCGSLWHKCNVFSPSLLKGEGCPGPQDPSPGPASADSLFLKVNTRSTYMFFQEEYYYIHGNEKIL